MRRALNCGVFVLPIVMSIAPATGQAPPVASALAQQIQEMVAEPTVSRAHWGLMVTAMDGAPIVAMNEGQLFQPASNTKLFTTAAALALLGGDRTFETKVSAKGHVDAAGKLMGDIVLEGGGDANLSGRELPYVAPGAKPKGFPSSARPSEADPLPYLAQMADAVAATGLKVVDGDVVGDDTFFPWEPYPIDWAVDDLVWGYGAPVSALSINDNQIKVTVSPSAAAGQDALVAIDPAVPTYYDVIAGHQLVTGMAGVGNNVEIARAPGSKELRLYGGIGLGAAADVEEVAIQDPAEFAAMALKTMLEARGIRVTGVARAQHAISTVPTEFLRASKEMGDILARNWVTGENVCDQGTLTKGIWGVGEWTVLARHVSAPLREDVVVTNKVSQNLHAELLLHQLGRSVGCYGSGWTGAGVVRAFLQQRARIDKDDFVFYDGSGMSGHDLVTPRAIAKLLAFAATQPWFADFKRSLPVGSVDGTLESRFTEPPLKGHVFAKTGTMGEGRALSGYLEGASGRTVIFSILVGNHAPRTSADRDVMDRIVGAIAAAN